MTLHELKTAARKTFKPIILLERVFPRKIRQRVSFFLTILSAVFFLGIVLTYAFLFFEISLGAGEEVIQRVFVGLFLVTLSLRLTLALIAAFYNAHYFRGFTAVIEDSRVSDDAPCVSFEVAEMLSRTARGDVTEDFLYSPIGHLVHVRAGVEEEALEVFLAKKKPYSGEDMQFDSSSCTTIDTYAGALYDSDREFLDFLTRLNIQKDDWAGAAAWVARTLWQTRREERWWSRENLGKIPGIGKEIAYGNIYLLERYGKDIATLPVYHAIAPHAPYGEREVESLEAVLARSIDQHALLVGEEGVGKREIIARLARKIHDGSAAPSLEHKRIFLLDWNALIASHGEKESFEMEFLRVLTQAIKAGNIILVIENLPASIESSAALGTDILSTLLPFLSLSSLQIIATSPDDAFHETLEKNEALMRYFETIAVEMLGEGAIIRMLEDFVPRFENENGVVVTYPALKAIAEGSERYFPYGVVQTKALDLLSEICARTDAEERHYITEKEVTAVLAQKTGIPMGDVEEDEKEKLEHLEALLHQRIVGQEEAVSSVSAALRRARAGVGSEDRPMGSFLFLGPTGVGKTETVKALAEVFFGDRQRILRFDMSEYSGDDALSRLIGDASGARAGAFSSEIREKRYGVLLLDELEKAHRDAHNVLLQILDEGEFHDARGQKVNTRSLIVIATSNAGSTEIWDYFKKRESVNAHKDELIDGIIQSGTFSPEFLNRFDGVIVFHPLSEEHVRKIAALMLEDFKKQLAEDGISFHVNDAVLDFLVQKGYDPKFGARPMRRAIQDTVEQIIAEKKIAGEVKDGSRVELTKSDLDTQVRDDTIL